MEETKTTSRFSEDITNLVIARLETIPSNIEMSIGGDGNFTVQELIERVRRQDHIGKKMIDMQMSYLRSLGNLPTQKFGNASTAN